jgi:hypothetical protein
MQANPHGMQISGKVEVIAIVARGRPVSRYGVAICTVPGVDSLHAGAVRNSTRNSTTASFDVVRRLVSSALAGELREKVLRCRRGFLNGS